MTRHYALSLKQPWAALLVAGRKTVEVRRWTASHRGVVLIHAARVPDRRAEAWAQVPPELLEAASLGGGIVGVAVLDEVKVYRTAEAFVADRELHWNDPSWFEPAGLFGFVFRDARPLPYRRLPGQVRLFTCEAEGPEPPPYGDRERRLLRSFKGDA